MVNKMYIYILYKIHFTILMSWLPEICPMNSSHSAWYKNMQRFKLGGIRAEKGFFIDK